MSPAKTTTPPPASDLPKAAPHAAPEPGPAGRHIRPAQTRSFVRPFLLAILFFALALGYVVLKPFIHVAIFGAVLAALFHPLQTRLFGYPPKRKNLAALVMILLICVLIVIPAIVVCSAMIDQGIQFTGAIKAWIRAGHLDNLQNNPHVLAVLAWLKERIPGFEVTKIDIQSHLLGITGILSEFFLRNSAQILGNVANLFLNGFLVIIIVFYLIREGVGLLAMAKRLSPLRSHQEDMIVDKIREVSRSVMLGSLFTAALQGVTLGFGMSMVGIPGFFWGSMTAFASLVPVVGSALVFVPAVGYLMIVGAWGSALFLGLWAGVFSLTIDNIIRPMVMKGKGGLPPFYIFLSILGGMQFYGLAGLLYGPLIISFAMVMLSIYEVEYQDALQDQHECAPSKP